MNFQSAISVGRSLALPMLVLAWIFVLFASGLDLGLILLASLAVIAIRSGFCIAKSPRAALRRVMHFLLCAWFRVEIDGAEHLETKGPVVFAPNHLSLIDGPMLFALIGRPTAFAMTGKWANRGWMKLLGRIIPIAAMDPDRPISAKTLVTEIQNGKACVVFPEGRLSATGNLMKVYPGAAWIMDQSNAMVVPVHFEGLEYSRWARFKNGYPRLLFPKVRVVVGAPRRLEVNPELKGRKRREAAVMALGDMLEGIRAKAIDHHSSLPEAIAAAASVFGRGRHVIADPMGTSLTYGKTLLGGDALARVFARSLAPGETIGVLLPTSAGMAVVLTALWRITVIPAMMNPTLGHGPALQALSVARARRVLSSRAMVEQAKLAELVAKMEAAGIEMIWIEDVKAAVGRRDKITALLSARFGRARQGRALSGRCDIARDDAAVVLFTSGTEGSPKGVVLSHANLLANASQLRARTDINASDRMLSALPLFHSLGLTGGLILPLLTGSDIFAYPSPLHMKQIPEAAYIHQSTIIIGTDTFLSGWGRRAARADFATVRAAIAGAEAVKPATRQLWMEKFGTRLLEGYGATECAPVLSLNTAFVGKEGSVGRLLPGMEARLEDIPGIPGKRLWVRGPNVMKGYLLADRPGELVAPDAGWYDTGDAVTIDDDQFVTISGRVKRFAKIGGEMVSLAAVEALASKVWPGVPLAAVALPDPRKGNRVVLCIAPHDRTIPDAVELRSRAKLDGISEIMLPAAIQILASIPTLASGKTDYPSLHRQIEEISISA